MRAASTTVADHRNGGPVCSRTGELARFPFERDRLVMERLFQASSLAMCVIDPALRVVMANEAALRVLAACQADIVGRSTVDFLPAASDMLRNCLERAAAGQPLPDRQVYWRGAHYHLTFGVTRNNEGAVSEIFVSALDITHRAKIERQLRDARRHAVATSRRDHLTGLLNRRGLEAVLHRELRRARRAGSSLSLVLVDIDWFKAYNDSVGHPQGDKCLRLVGGALRSCLRRSGDAGSRLGGEEFILILPHTDAAGAAAVAENCRRALQALNIRHPGSPMGRVTVSIGISAAIPTIANGSAAAEAAALMAAADKALYRAKKMGRDRAEIFTRR